MFQFQPPPKPRPSGLVQLAAGLALALLVKATAGLQLIFFAGLVLAMLLALAAGLRREVLTAAWSITCAGRAPTRACRLSRSISTPSRQYTPRLLGGIPGQKPNQRISSTNTW